MADDFEDQINALLADVDSSDKHEDVDVSEFDSNDGGKFSMEAFAKKAKMFDSKVEAQAPKKSSIHEVDLSRHEFAEITNFISRSGL